VLDAVGRRAHPTVVEARRPDPRSMHKGFICLEAALGPGFCSVWYHTEWKVSGNLSGWAREMLWAVVGTGGGGGP